MGAAKNRRRTAPGTLGALARYVLCGGGVGLASAFAVAGLAALLPWARANALVTLVSTLLATELHARFTFGPGGRATRRQHAQSAGSALAAYAATCLAVLALHHLVEQPGAALQQAVYLSASALAGAARFAVLRLIVFTRSRTGTTAPLPLAPVTGLGPATGLGRATDLGPVTGLGRATDEKAPADRTALCRAA